MSEIKLRFSYQSAILKEFSYLSKLDLDKTDTIIRIALGSIQAHMCVIKIKDTGEIDEIIYFSDKVRDTLSKKEFKLELPSGEYIYDFMVNRVVYSSNKKAISDTYWWNTFNVPTRYTDSTDDFIVRIDDTLYKSSIDMVGLAVVKNNIRSFTYKSTMAVSDLGFSIIKKGLNIERTPTWIKSDINYNGTTEFYKDRYPFLLKLSSKI